MNARTRIAVAVVLVSLSAPAALAQRVRIGTFDSRAVAVAYWNSPRSAEVKRQVQLEAQSARTSKNTIRIRAAELAALSMQARMHQQAFSIGSVAEITATIQDALPAIAKKNDVALVVSKWEIAWSDGAVETVDVTDDVVALFEPAAKTRKWIEEMKSMKPVPVSELPAGDH